MVIGLLYGFEILKNQSPKYTNLNNSYLRYTECMQI